MELCNGISLSKYIATSGKIDERLAALLIKQILKSLTYLQEKRIIHFDLKGQNIIVNERGAIKLIDFGESKEI
jgi:serine/threonine protein kinase